MRSVMFLLLSIVASCNVAVAEELANDAYAFDDTILEEALEYPDWFQLSSGDLREDIKEAVAQGKQGIMLYFGQKRCSYCEQFFKKDLGEPDIVSYIQNNFNVIAVDIWDIDDIIDTDGETYSERDLSLKYETNFTPSLIFYDQDGKSVYRLRGFHPPYKFRAALKYVVEKFYDKETFREYLARAEPGMFFYNAELNDRDFFSAAPFDLASAVKQGKPVAVFFEQGKCHACDLLHTGPLNDERAIEQLENMHVVQLNMASDEPVTTPDGEKTTAKAWAGKLGLFHAPSILFFDDNGKEVMRVDSIVQFYRIWGVLDYINQRAYKTETDYQKWRLAQRDVGEPEVASD